MVCNNADSWIKKSISKVFSNVKSKSWSKVHVPENCKYFTQVHTITGVFLPLFNSRDRNICVCCVCTSMLVSVFTAVLHVSCRARASAHGLRRVQPVPQPQRREEVPHPEEPAAHRRGGARLRELWLRQERSPDDRVVRTGPSPEHQVWPPDARRST